MAIQLLGEEEKLAEFNKIKALCVQVMQLVERSGEVVFDDLPTFFKENSGKSIQAGCFVRGH